MITTAEQSWEKVLEGLSEIHGRDVDPSHDDSTETAEGPDGLPNTWSFNRPSSAGPLPLSGRRTPKRPAAE